LKKENFCIEKFFFQAILNSADHRINTLIISAISVILRRKTAFIFFSREAILSLVGSAWNGLKSALFG
jgi:hypothetical protein